jgi:hypothetical protein
MGEHVGSSYSLVDVACQGGTTITSGWPANILPIGNPSIGGPINRSTDKSLTCMSPTNI